jgi:hypothetical protein
MQNSDELFIYKDLVIKPMLNMGCKVFDENSL